MKKWDYVTFLGSWWLDPSPRSNPAARRNARPPTHVAAGFDARSPPTHEDACRDARRWSSRASARCGARCGARCSATHAAACCGCVYPGLAWRRTGGCGCVLLGLISHPAAGCGCVVHGLTSHPAGGCDSAAYPTIHPRCGAVCPALFAVPFPSCGPGLVLASALLLARRYDGYGCGFGFYDASLVRFAWIASVRAGEFPACDTGRFPHSYFHARHGKERDKVIIRIPIPIVTKIFNCKYLGNAAS